MIIIGTELKTHFSAVSGRDDVFMVDECPATELVATTISEGHLPGPLMGGGLVPSYNTSPRGLLSASTRIIERPRNSLS